MSRTGKKNNTFIREIEIYNLLNLYNLLKHNHPTNKITMAPNVCLAMI